jgi:poly-gamma-glutamate synthesis protein (capsule biosynthesis protein)
MSTTFVRYLHALRALPRTTEGVSMDWILLDALFTRSDSAGNPYQESFNFTYANTELEEKLHALLRTLGLSDAQVQQVVLRAHSNDVTQTIAAEQQIVEQQLKTRRIPTLLFGGRRYDRVVSDRELQSGAPVLPLVQYVTQTPSPSPSPLPVKVIFGGDMMYDRHIRLRTQEHGLEWPLQALAPLFHTANAVIVNGEGPITTFSSKSVGSAVGSHDNFIFTFPIGVAQTWQSQGVTHVNLGNNHILNFGQEGLQQTWTYLNESGIAAFGYTGQQRDVATQPRTQTLAFPGLRIALVNYNQFVAGGEKAVFADIAAVRPTHDVVIVYTHWGDEYAQVIRPPIRDLAHRMIDAGADLIVGSHPHVVQPVETYNGKQIYYSLGNLVFDQYFQKETQEGLLLEIQLEGGKGITSLTTHAVQLVHSGQTILLPEQ